MYTIPDPAAKERFPANVASVILGRANIGMWSCLGFEAVSGASQGRSSDLGVKHFKRRLKKSYNLGTETKKLLFDMATGTELPHSIVVASHIFQYRWRLYLSSFSSITDINDARNGLFLYKPVEWAFDRARLCIEVRGGGMFFRLLDPDLATVKLTDKAREFRDIVRTPEIEAAEAHLETTFGDLDGAELHIPPSSEMRPSKRLLTLHAYACWFFANRNIPPPPSDNVSEDGETTEVLLEVVPRWLHVLQTK
jgi:hypothetical protein